MTLHVLGFQCPQYVFNYLNFLYHLFACFCYQFSDSAFPTLVQLLWTAETLIIGSLWFFVSLVLSLEFRYLNLFLFDFSTIYMMWLKDWYNSQLAFPHTGLIEDRRWNSVKLWYIVYLNTTKGMYWWTNLNIQLPAYSLDSCIGIKTPTICIWQH